MISYHPSTEAPVEAMYRGITGVLVRIEEHPSLVQMKDVDYRFFFDTFTMRGRLEVAGSGAIEKIGGHICSQAASRIWKSQCLSHLCLVQNRGMQKRLCIDCGVL